jgi:pentapeptide repeat protein
LQVSRGKQNLEQQQETTAEFTAAIDQVSQTGVDKADIRIGGIHALGRLAVESRGYCESIRQILVAFVREHALQTPSVLPAQPITSLGSGRSEDIAAALQEISNLGCRLSSGLNVRHVDLSGFDLTGLKLEEAYFFEANLQEAILRCTDFESSHFQSAHLKVFYRSTFGKGRYLYGTS